MERFSDDEFSTPKGHAHSECMPATSSPISSALDSSPLKWMLGSASFPDDSTGLDNNNDNAEHFMEEEELEVVESIHNVTGLREKMAGIMRELRARRLGVGTFIRAWVEQDDSQRTRRVGLLRRLASQDPVLREVFGRDEENTSGSFEALVTQEFNNLVDRPFFNRFKEEDRPEDIRYAGADEELERSAPVWNGFLMRVLQHSRAHRESYAQRKDQTPIRQKAYLITSVICGARATKTSNYLAKTLGLYMLSSGVKRRVIEVLNSLGICGSFTQLNKLYDRIADKGAGELRVQARDPQAVVVYDNFNFMDYVRDQTLGNFSVMRNLTTGLLVTSSALPMNGLTQRMLRRHVALDGRQMLLSSQFRRDAASQELTRFLILNAISQLHPGIKTSAYKDDEFPKPPVFEILPAHQTKVWQLATIFQDEGTLEGTHLVHDEIWKNQFGFKPNEDEADARYFSEKLLPVFGDQKTASLLRSVCSMQRRSSLDYDKRKWMLGLPAYWHIMQALLTSILKVHYESLDEEKKAIFSRATVQHDANFLQRRGISPSSVKFHLVEPLVIGSWNARIGAILYRLLQRDGQGLPVESRPSFQTTRLDKSVEQGTMDAVDDMISHLSRSQLEGYVEEIRQLVFTRDSWKGQDPQKNSLDDKEFVSMCRFLQSGEIFLALRHAVRHGDIGLIRRLIGPLSVWFYGSAQPKYGQEMLYLQWLLSDAVSDPELQHAILGSGLVNIIGRGNTFKAIDVALEHVNAMYHIDMKMRKNSTHDVDKTFRRVALASSYTTMLRATVESTFGRNSSSDHTTKDARRDAFALAMLLLDSGCAWPRSKEELRPSERMFEASDTISIGLKALGEKINSFNNTIVEPLDLPARMFGAELDENDQGKDETERFAAEYVTATDDNFYGQES